MTFPKYAALLDKPIDGRLLGLDTDFMSGATTAFVLDAEKVVWAVSVRHPLRVSADDIGRMVKRSASGFMAVIGPDADRVLRAVYVWCAMAAACQKTSRMTCDRHEDTAEPVWVRS